MSPALIAAYQMQLPDKALLQARLHELHELYMQNVAIDPEHDLGSESFS